MRKLQDYRGEIDKIDKEIIALFEKRLAAAEQIGIIKKEGGKNVFDPKREAEVLASRLAWLENPQNENLAAEFMKNLMRLSRIRQNAIAGGRVAYQGLPGSYGEEAASRLFPENLLTGLETFWDVFEAVRDGSADYGVVPIENSSTGSITEIYDLLSKYDLFINAETNLEINHCLLGARGAQIKEIKRVFSHSQALSQCHSFLKGRGWELCPQENTAVSARHVANEGGAENAAIASERAANIYGLSVLARDISTGRQNSTRFIAMSKTESAGAGNNKISLAFTLPHRSGSLMEALNIFALKGVNLLKIESRPIMDRLGEYLFFVDLEGDIASKNVSEALSLLREKTERFKYMGSFVTKL